MSTFEDTVAETINQAETYPVGSVTTLADVISNVLTQQLQVSMTQAFTVYTATELTSNQGYLVSAADTSTLGGALLVSWGQVINDAFDLADSLDVGWTLHETVSETSELAAELICGWGQTVAETITTTDALVTIYAVQVLEDLAISPAALTTSYYQQSVGETVTLVDDLRRFLGGDLSETIGVDSVLLGIKVAPATISEAVSIASTQTPSLIVRVTAAETVDFADADVIRMLFSQTVAEGIEIGAAYLSPGEGFTTWAMNTRTAAVTEYQNFEFNSFAKIGHKYIGATSDGLYELTGDDDAGSPIIADMLSGFAQFAGTKFTMFKGIYLGVRGEGDWVLKLITGDDKTYNYAVSTRNMRSTKVHLGKGLRARYFRFELISTGQDFDLESIEFVPLVADRRV